MRREKSHRITARSVEAEENDVDEAVCAPASDHISEKMCQVKQHAQQVYQIYH